MVRLATAAEHCSKTQEHGQRMAILKLQKHDFETANAAEPPERITAIQSNPVARDVLACRIVSVDAMPAAICDLYDVQPSRDLWKAIMLTWLEQVRNRCTGCFSDYYLKCTLGRLLAVRRVDHGCVVVIKHNCHALLLCCLIG